MFSCCKLQVFYLDVAYVSYTCCKYMFQIFHLLQTYVAFKYFMLQVFYVSEVCSESHWGHGLGAVVRGAVCQGPAGGARGAPRVLRTGRARPRPGS
jgi:hypothetical protein